jgi:hypothetical protein
MIESNLINRINQINLTSFANGAYFYNLHIGEDTLRGKIIKN